MQKRKSKAQFTSFKRKNLHERSYRLLNFQAEIAICTVKKEQPHISDKNETSSFSLAPKPDFMQVLMTSTGYRENQTCPSLAIF